MATPTYTVTPISNRTEYGTVSQPVTGTAGTVALLTATAKSNGTFLCWSDGSTENPHRYSIPAKDVVIKAYFYQKNPVKYLLDLAGLTRFWTKIKEWFSNIASKETSGAKQIGFCRTDTTYTKDDVQAALEEVKAQSDYNQNQMDYVKTNYVKRDPADIATNPMILTGNYEFFPVSLNADYSVVNQYFSSRDSGSSLYFRPVSCIDETYDSTEDYYTFDAANADYIKAVITSEASFDAEKANLYYMKANNMTFSEWKTTGLYIGVGASGQKADWRSNQTWAGGMPHSGVISVSTGFNSGFEIWDDTINKIMISVNGKGKFGSGGEALSAMFIKGHHVRVHCFHTVDGGDGTWSRICLSFFGD